MARRPPSWIAAQEGHAAGTLAFMSPEQASGRSDLLDVRTDVYGLGATLYQKKNVFGLTQKGRKLEKVRLLTTAPQQVVSIGQDAAGEIYLVGYEGNLYRLDLASSRWE